MTGDTPAIYGLFFLVPAMGGTAFVVADFVFGHGAVLAVTLLLAVFFVLAWFALPHRYHNANGD